MKQNIVKIEQPDRKGFVNLSIKVKAYKKSRSHNIKAM